MTRSLERWRAACAHRSKCAERHRLVRGTLLSGACLLSLQPTEPRGFEFSAEAPFETHLFEVFSLNDELTLTQSASVSLSMWCRKNTTAAGLVRAHRIDSPIKPATASIRALLKANPDDTINYRKVDLDCGNTTLSEADNWYVPHRLPKAIREALDRTDIPFGLAVKSLQPSRTHLQTVLKTTTVRQDEKPSFALMQRPQNRSTTLFTHRALLMTKEGPISLVEENYQTDLLNLILSDQVQAWRQNGVQGAPKP